MARFITMDIVFYANSLNYDQGSGNYQELKKITKWDGRQYTFVSRYALRYSLLETGKRLGLWQIAEGDTLQRAGEGTKTTIQPAIDMLLNGEILKYPEFDLFGYLITQPKDVKQPQNFRVAPVKISHAISLTPFNYDALFNANIGLANRLRKQMGKMDPNPFTSEEHFAYYVYSLVIDLEEVGKVEVYIKEKEKIQLSTKEKWTIDEITEKNSRIEVKLKNNKKEEKIIHMWDSVTGELESLPEVKILRFTLHKLNDEPSKPEELAKNHEEVVNKRVQDVITSILNLHRSIRGRDEDLTPKLLVLGVYNDTPYKTYKDSISLVDEQIEEEYDEIEEESEGDKRIVKVKHVATKSKKPVFRIRGISGKCKEINESEILQAIRPLFNNNLTPSDSGERNTNNNSAGKQRNNLSNVSVFYAPGIEVKLDDKITKSS